MWKLFSTAFMQYYLKWKAKEGLNVKNQDIIRETIARLHQRSAAMTFKWIKKITQHIECTYDR